MILPPDFEARVIDLVRRCTDDIVECATAEIKVIWQGQAPAVRFGFGALQALGRPTLTIGLVAESRLNPLAPGRLISFDQLNRHVRSWVEEYLKLNGIELTRKVVTDACL